MNSPTLRIVDANLNRAREALRVLEDYARFAIDHDGLCGELKAIRHDLAAATGPYAAEAILHRDTPNDVGTDNKAPAELERHDLAHVVTAAGKRLGEALRAVEECLKTVDPPAASNVELLRYEFYDVEMRLARTLRGNACAVAGARFSDVRLYVLVTESLCAGRPWMQVVADAIDGGADCVQLREKDLEPPELLRRARWLADFCRDHGVISIVNDRPDVAMMAGADGVHVGQGDLPAVEVRKLVGNDLILGVSTHAPEQARQAMLDGADYLGVGPVFPSPTKPRDILPGPDYARAAAAAVQIPCIAIAGITPENAAEVMATGVSGVAVSSAVIAAPDVRAAAARLKAAVGGARGTGIPACVSPGIPARPEPGPSGGTGIPACVSPGIPARPQPASLQKRFRNLPHWSSEGATYFITFRTTIGELSPDERLLVLEHVRKHDGEYYDLLACVVMPDHCHLILKPLRRVSLDRILKGTKGVTARLINQGRGRRGNVWQDESFDRIIRDQAELEETANYIYENPARSGLVAAGAQYPTMFLRRAH